MDDVLTDIPPPSRFFLEDLNNFTPPSPPLPRPFFVFSTPNPTFRPSLLIIAISSPSVHFLHHVLSTTLVGTLVLPEIPVAGNSIEPSVTDKSCNVYTLNDADKLTMIVSVQYPIPVERSYSVAELLIGEQIIPERVLILDSIQRRNFRGKLSPDDTFVFRLETSLEKKQTDDNHGQLSPVKSLDYFPSGSVVDGFGAALLSRCQVKKIKGILCVTWPEFGVAVTSLVESLLLKILPGIDYSGVGNIHDELLRSARGKDSPFDSELYT